MATITIKDVPPLDGEYEFDPSTLNGRELHTIKEIAGVRGHELSEASAAGDYDLVIAFTVVALHRAGITVHADQLLEAQIGSIIVNYDDEAAEVRPPASPSPSGNEDEHGDNENSNESNELSGAHSSNGSVPLPSDLSRTGPRGSGPSAASALGIFAS